MELRKVADEKEARALLARAARGGMALVAVARAHGVDGRSLNAWKCNLERSEGRRPVEARPVRQRARRPGLVEVVPSEVLDRRRVRGEARYALRLGRVELEFGDDADPETLRRVVEVLRSC